MTGLCYVKDKWCEISFQRKCDFMIIFVVFKTNVHWIRFSLMSWQGRFHLHMLIKMTKYIWHTMVLCFWILSLQSVNLLASRKIKMKNYFVFMNFASLILIDYAWRCGFTTWHVWKNELGKPLWEDHRLMLYYLNSAVVIFYPWNHSLSYK